MSRHAFVAMLLLVATLTLAGCESVSNGGLQQVLDTALGDGPLDEGTVAAGLKEALRVGTDRTVSVVSLRDGYLGNPLIRIPLPGELTKAAATLRGVGLGAPVDELETAMNRAAEQAAGEAAAVFVGAITRMTVADAFAILDGGDTAATDYFRGKTSAELTARFRPIVRTQLDDVGLARLYDRVVAAYDAIPLTQKPVATDLDAYVTDGALRGLFTVLGQEERKIRQDPLARTTALLEKVFGRK